MDWIESHEYRIHILHFFYRLIQSVFLLPRYLERNHEKIKKTFQEHGMFDADLPESVDQNQNVGKQDTSDTMNISKKLN